MMVTTMMHVIQEIFEHDGNNDDAAGDDDSRQQVEQKHNKHNHKHQLSTTKYTKMMQKHIHACINQ